MEKDNEEYTPERLHKTSAQIIEVKNALYQKLEDELDKNKKFQAELKKIVEQKQFEALRDGKSEWCLAEKDLEYLGWYSTAYYMLKAQNCKGKEKEECLNKVAYPYTKQLNDYAQTLDVKDLYNLLSTLHIVGSQSLCEDLSFIFADDIPQLMSPMYLPQTEYKYSNLFNIERITDVLFDYAIKYLAKNEWTVDWVMDKKESDMFSKFKTAVYKL